ncbi:hypothetical protein C5167_033929, partial [Papaver somniferum]
DGGHIVEGDNSLGIIYMDMVGSKMKERVSSKLMPTVKGQIEYAIQIFSNLGIGTVTVVLFVCLIFICMLTWDAKSGPSILNCMFGASSDVGWDMTWFT